VAHQEHRHPLPRGQDPDRRNPLDLQPGEPSSPAAEKLFDEGGAAGDFLRATMNGLKPDEGLGQLDDVAHGAKGSG